MIVIRANIYEVSVICQAWFQGHCLHEIIYASQWYFEVSTVIMPSVEIFFHLNRFQEKRAPRSW